MYRRSLKDGGGVVNVWETLRVTTSHPKIEKIVSRIFAHFTLQTPRYWGQQAVSTISKGSVEN